MLAKDKQLHLIVGFICGSLITFFSNIHLAISIGVIVAIGKEVYDHYHPKNHTAEVLDVLTTIIGAIVGSALIWVIRHA